MHTYVYGERTTRSRGQLVPEDDSFPGTTRSRTTRSRTTRSRGQLVPGDNSFTRAFSQSLLPTLRPNTLCFSFMIIYCIISTIKAKVPVQFFTLLFEFPPKLYTHNLFPFTFCSYSFYASSLSTYILNPILSLG